MYGGAGTPPAWFKIAIVTVGILLIVGPLTFERHRIEVELDSPQVVGVGRETQGDQVDEAARLQLFCMVRQKSPWRMVPLSSGFLGVTRLKRP
jgi:hypothetical protein